jgi:hypothetical protein
MIWNVYISVTAHLDGREWANLIKFVTLLKDMGGKNMKKQYQRHADLHTDLLHTIGYKCCRRIRYLQSHARSVAGPQPGAAKIPAQRAELFFCAT